MARLVDGLLGITEEHHGLRDAVRSFADRHLTSEVVRVSLDAETSTAPSFWPALGDSGFLGLHVAEENGGSGYGLVELCVVVEELGSHLVPGPFLGTVALSAILRRAGSARPDRELDEALVADLASLCDGRLTGAVAVGGTLEATEQDSGLRVTGALPPTPGLVLADRVAVLAGETWVVLHRDELTDVVDHTGLDPSRRAGTAAVDVLVPAGRVLSGLHPEAPEVLWALLVSAEACGSAAWSTRTAAEYALVREQFGRPIGAFQGVKHRCADMLARTEQARVVTWDAARALEELWTGRTPAPVADLAVAVAASLAPGAALANAKACIDTLGAVGYTWEHEASFHLRRARTTSILVGGTARWQHRVGELSLAGTRREVGVELPPEAEQVRAEVRAELTEAAALEGEARQRYLAGHGYTAPHLPRPWGRGAGAVEQLVVAEELAASGLSAPRMIIGSWVVPTLVEHGTAEQQQRLIPDSLTGQIFWCQLFSEPGAGSDLAALTTRAEKVEGGWRVKGTKIWTSAAQFASHGILLARTDPAAAKHAGISYFVLDMTTPGITIAPIRDLTGETHFNQVFLDDVFVPDENLVGEPGQGWRLARTTLANERVALGTGSLLGSAGEELLRRVTGDSAPPDAQRLTTLGRLLADAQSVSLFGLRSALRSVAGAQPGAESSIAKYLGVTHTQEAWEVAVEWGGVAGLTGSGAGDGVGGDPTWWFLNARNQSIAGGTLDVQRNIIGERLLGLPRDA